MTPAKEPSGQTLDEAGLLAGPGACKREDLERQAGAIAETRRGGSPREGVVGRIERIYFVFTLIFFLAAMARGAPPVRAQLRSKN